MTLVLEEPEIDPEAVHIIIADGQPLARGALRQALACEHGATDIREAGDLAALSRALAGGGAPDLVLLDLATPGVGGFSGLLYLRSRHPDVPVVVVSATEDRAVMRRCIEVGAAGYIPKGTDADILREAVRMVLDGEIWTPSDLDAIAPPDAAAADMMRRLGHLTPQQLRVLMMLTQGLLNKQIAYELNVSEATVKAHVSAILQKLDVDSRTQAVLAVSKVEGGCFSKAKAS